MFNQNISEIYLVLGCFGLIENEILQCLGIENKIISINKKMIDYPKMMDFFDRYKLFDNSILDSNGIKNFLFLFKETFNSINQRVWSEVKFKEIFNFIERHKNCGLYLNLSLSFEEKKPVEKSIIITPVNSSTNKILANKNVLISKFKQMKGKTNENRR